MEIETARNMLIRSGLWPLIRPALRFVRQIMLYIPFTINKYVRITALNIGGGPDFVAIGWVNLEEVPSIFNPNPYRLTQGSTFPIKHLSMKIVYTSHCLEHLDEKTVNRVLSEAYRVLMNDGILIIKLPDYDLALDRWRNYDAAFFDGWDYCSATYTWGNRGLSDQLDYRASMLFCGFWNDAYGDHFSKNISRNKAAYHGPAVTTVPFLRDLIKDHTPSQISAELGRIVMDNEKGYHFNHRSSWSRKELADLLNSNGFRIVTFDSEVILNKYKNVPGIKQMMGKSMFCLAEKNI